MCLQLIFIIFYYFQSHCPQLGLLFIFSGFFTCFSSVRLFSPILCDPMDCSTLVFPAHHQLPSLLKLMTIKSMMPSNLLILCGPLLPPSIFPSISVFSESALRIRWPRNWSFRTDFLYDRLVWSSLTGFFIYFTFW